MWSLWLIYNKIIFHNGSFEMINLLDIIKVRSWSLFQAKVGRSCSIFADWCVNPVGCLTF